MRAAATCLALLGLACGYQFAGGRMTALGPEVRTVALQPFENRSSEPGLELWIGEALVEEFDRRGDLDAVVRRAPQAQAVLGGVVREVRVQSAAFSSAAVALEDSVRAVIDVRVQRTGSDEVLWRRGGLQVEERYATSADPQLHESQKEQALRRLATRIAQRIHDELYAF